MPGGPGALKPTDIFTAFQERREPRRRWPLLALAALVGLGAWGALRREVEPIRLATREGFKSIHLGMTLPEVTSVLGRPLLREQRGGAECFQYGQPVLNEPTFVLFLLCYEDGKLREVTTRRYNAWVVGPDGAISPAPVEGLREQAPPQPSPPSTSP
jgi:hypothetical protein